MNQGPSPLDGIRVLEVGSWITTPLTGKILAELGADVIKVEPADGDPFRRWRNNRPSPRFAAYNAGKRSVVLDLRRRRSRDDFQVLLRTASVLVVGLRPSAARALELEYSKVAAAHPALVYCSITGFGESGPDRDRPGYETVVQALSGLLSTIVDWEHPQPIGPPFLEHVTALYAVNAILAALLRRDSSGAHLEVSMLGAGLALLSEPLAIWKASGEVFSARSRPAYSQAYTFRCSDGQILALHLSAADINWTRFLAALSDPIPDLHNSDRFGSREARIAHRDEIQALLEPVLASQPREYWLRQLDSHSVPAARMNRITDLDDDPQVKAVGASYDVFDPSSGERFQLMGTPASGQPQRPPAEVPGLGEHTESIRQELGLRTEGSATRPRPS